jgi:hypothetical protein
MRSSLLLLAIAFLYAAPGCGPGGDGPMGTDAGTMRTASDAGRTMRPGDPPPSGSDAGPMDPPDDPPPDDPPPDDPPSPWSANAVEHRGTMMTVSYDCPGPGTAGSVWGTDVYTDDSSVCTAAVHAGRITLETGGRVTIQMMPGQMMYAGSERNGVTTSDWSTPWEGSFQVMPGM